MASYLAALAVGVALLAYAADHFVLGAARLAAILRLSPVVIGAVIVGFGTSAPELLVSAIAAAGGDLDVGVGNVIGSNVANLTLILGSAALFLPIAVRSRVVRREAPLSVASVLVFALLLQGRFRVWEGVLMLALLAVALAVIITTSEGDVEVDLADEIGPLDDRRRLRPESVRTLVGLAGTIAGAYALVWGAEGLADRFGLSGGFIGLSLVAVGTSLPELVTAIAAARQGEQELIVGNLLGSNVFNSLAVGGAVALLAPDVAAEASLRTTGALLMAAIAIAAFVMMVTARRVRRLEGAVLLVAFASFLVITYLTQPGDVHALAAASPGVVAR